MLTVTDDVTRQINLIGKHIRDQGGARVAIYLPNSVEFIAILFACAFHDLTAILIPFDQSDEAIISMLRQSAADTVIALPGSFPFETVFKSYPSLRQLIWVVDEGNRHLDWNEVPQGVGGSVNVATWQDIIQESPVDAGKELPPLEGQPAPQDVTTFWHSKSGEVEEMVHFTNANFVSAIAAQLFAVPQSQRLGPSDLFLPADALTNTYTLVLTLTALYSNASVAFNSSTSDEMDLSLATRGIAPTVVVASPKALLKTHEETRRHVSSFLASKVHWLQTTSLTQNGVMPVASLLTSYNDSLRPAIGRTPGKLRIVYTAELAGSGTTPPLPSAVLSDLRVYLNARVIYALAAAKVAGAVSQTQFYDYRVHEDKCSHFGPPLTCTEILLRESGDHKITDDIGEVSVSPQIITVKKVCSNMVQSRLSPVDHVSQAARLLWESLAQSASTTRSPMPEDSNTCAVECLGAICSP